MEAAWPRQAQGGGVKLVAVLHLAWARMPPTVLESRGMLSHWNGLAPIGGEGWKTLRRVARPMMPKDEGDTVVLVGVG